MELAHKIEDKNRATIHISKTHKNPNPNFHSTLGGPNISISRSPSVQARPHKTEMSLIHPTSLRIHLLKILVNPLHQIPTPPTSQPDP